MCRADKKSCDRVKILEVEVKSCDGHIFKVKREVAEQSVVLRHAIEDVIDNPDIVVKTPIPIPNVHGDLLDQILKLCSDYEEGFVGNVKTADKDLLIAADYLAIDWLLDLTCQAFVDSMEEDMRRMFNMSMGYTPEEEAVGNNLLGL